MEQQQSTELTQVEPANPAILKAEETAEGRIKQEIKRFSLPDKKIAEMKKAYSGLKICELPAPDDKEGLKKYREQKEAVRLALQIVRKVRTTLEEKRKELKADYLKVGQGIDAEAKRLTALVVPIEEPLKEKLEAAEKAEEDRKLEAERAEQEKLQARVTSLLEAGIKFDGSFYSIGQISVDVVTMKNLPDDKFEDLVGKVKVAKEAEDAEALEAKRKEEEETARLKKEREDFDKAQAELREQQAELQRQKDALAKQQEQARKQVTEARKNRLESLGLSWVNTHQLYVFNNISGRVEVSIDEIINSAEDQWTTIATNIVKLLGEIKVKEDARLEELDRLEKNRAEFERRTKDRIFSLVAQGFFHSDQTGHVWFRPVNVPQEQGLVLPVSTIANVSLEEWDKYFQNWMGTKKELEELGLKLEREAYEAGEVARKEAQTEKEAMKEYFQKVSAIEWPLDSLVTGSKSVLMFQSALLEVRQEFGIQ